MTNWGAVLLVAYVALGLSGLSATGRAMRWATWLTVVVISAVVIKVAAL